MHRARLEYLGGVLLLLSSLAAGQRPDIHGGGIKPSLIPNHETTQVLFPGFHFAGVQMTVDGACTLVSYTNTDRMITMRLHGDRAMSDHDGNCNVHLKNPYGTANTWLIVDLTDAEKDQVEARDHAAGEAKAAQMVERAGKEWTIHFANGTSEVYTYASVADTAMALFNGPRGRHLRILVSDNHTVLLRDDSDCMRIGKLEQGRVTDGKTYGGNCAPAGAWTATMR